MTNQRLFFNFVNFIEIEISSLCNRECEYCPQSKSKRERVLLPLDVLEKVMKDLNKVDFCGGIAYHQYNEPLLEWEHLLRCIEMSKKYVPRAKLVLYTNGDLLTKEKFKILKKKGIDEFHISVHYTKEERWSTEWALGKIKQFRKRLGLVFGSVNVSEDRVIFNPVKLRELAFKNKSYGWIKLKKYPTIVYIESANYLENGSNRMNIVKNGMKKVARDNSYCCPAILHNFNISHRGNVYLCWDCCEGISENEKYMLGSVYEDNIFDLFRKKMDYVNKFLSEEGLAECEKCFWNL